MGPKVGEMLCGAFGSEIAFWVLFAFLLAFGDPHGRPGALTVVWCGAWANTQPVERLCRNVMRPTPRRPLQDRHNGAGRAPLDGGEL